MKKRKINYTDVLLCCRNCGARKVIQYYKGQMPEGTVMISSNFCLCGEHEGGHYEESFFDAYGKELEFN